MKKRQRLIESEKYGDETRMQDTLWRERVRGRQAERYSSVQYTQEREKRKRWRNQNTVQYTHETKRKKMRKRSAML